MSESNAAASARGIVAALLAVLAIAGCGSSKPTAPAAGATKLVPADALVYVHLSTDTGRGATKDALAIARRFPGFGLARAALVDHLSAPQCGVDVGMLTGGKEAALALLDSDTGTANSLVLVDTGSDRARKPRACGAVEVEQIGRFLVIGQPPALQQARELARGHGRSLAAAPDYRRATADLPAGRVADAWVSRDGVRRLLAPQGGLLGAAGILLDQPALKGAALGLAAASHGARLTVQTILDPAVQKRTPQAFRPFTPSLPARVPGDAFVYLGVRGLPETAGRLLAALGPQASRIAPLLTRGRELAPLLDLFRGEVAVTLTPATPAPVLTLQTRTRDPRGAAATLRRLPGALARLFRGAVVGDEVVVSTSPSGIADVRSARTHLPDTASWRASVQKAQNPVTSLVFLDFNQLLRLGEQTGLNDSAAYRAVKADLRRVRAVSVRSSSAGAQSTAEIFLSIP